MAHIYSKGWYIQQLNLKESLVIRLNGENYKTYLIRNLYEDVLKKNSNKIKRV
jgi:hypothetical protein